MTVDVQISLRTSRLIQRDPEIYRWVLTSMALRGLELVTIRKQIQDLIIEPPLNVRIDM